MPLPVIASPWNFRAGLLVLASFAAVYTVASLGHIGVVKATVGMQAYLGDGPRLPPKLLLTGQLIKAAALLGVLWLLALRRHHLDWSALGLRPTTRRWLLLAALLAVAGLALRLGLAKLLVVGLPDWAAFMRSPYALDDAGPALVLALGASTVLLTPFAEELFFRGFLLTWMCGHRPAWLAVLVSSLIFGAMHLVPAQAISAALMALVLALLYLYSRSIWPPLLCHVVGNGLGWALSLAASAGSLPAWLTPG